MHALTATNFNNMRPLQKSSALDFPVLVTTRNHKQAGFETPKITSQLLLRKCHGLSLNVPMLHHRSARRRSLLDTFPRLSGHRISITSQFLSRPRPPKRTIHCSRATAAIGRVSWLFLIKAQPNVVSSYDHHKSGAKTSILEEMEGSCMLRNSRYKYFNRIPRE